jgi:hypothetical protein
VVIDIFAQCTHITKDEVPLDDEKDPNVIALSHSAGTPPLSGALIGSASELEKKIKMPNLGNRNTSACGLFQLNLYKPYAEIPHDCLRSSSCAQ